MGLISHLKQLQTWFKAQHFGKSAIDTRYALIEACIIGILSAFAALLLKQGIGWVGGWRVHLADNYGGILVLPLWGLALGYGAGWIVQNFSPQAAGGGIPQVKAALAKFPMGLSWRVAIVKLIGATLILGGGLTLGRRAPTVHIGAAIAAGLSDWLPTSPDHRRQMIAAGAAAGLAAGFTAPIAGVLFVIEELMRDVSSLTLETAIVASFTGAVVSMMLENTPPTLPDSVTISFTAEEIPLYLVLGTAAGCLGSLFNEGVLFFQRVQRRLNLSLAWRIGLISCFSGSVIAILPPFFRDNTGLREFLITGELSWQNTAVAFIAYFVLTMLAYSSGAPGGLLAPALVLGSALGFLLGEVVGIVFGIGTEATYALAGMGAFFTAVVRVPVTAIVIVFELHRNFSIVLPLMIACATAYTVAESIKSGSLYHHLLKTSNIDLKDDVSSNDVLSNLTAADVMQSNVETLGADLPLDELLLVMSRSHHRGFPVVDKGRLVGIFTQSDLDKLNQGQTFQVLREVMTPNPITITPLSPLTDVLYLLNRYQLSRLPVTDGQKLVGIITRTDIIRVEVNKLGGSTEKKFSPSYVVYQTRAPSLGKGRILLPIAKGESAATLFKIAAGIARERDYEIDCIQIIPVPKHSAPSEVFVDTKDSRKLLQRLERLARHQKVTVHTQIRIAQDIAWAIGETMRERHTNLLIMGWKGSTSTREAIFGNVVDNLIQNAPCDLMLVKLGTTDSAYPYRLGGESVWVVPVAGGPNAQKALEFLPGLTSLYESVKSPQIWLSKIYSPTDLLPDISGLEMIITSIESYLKKPIIPLPVRSASVAEAIIHLTKTESPDAIILGASREGLLSHAIYGNIPSAIASGVDCTVILVRTGL
ncbi:MAG: H(+)/Cl(-) exchange transporter ClcA [Chroococcopsis gigantea SAG 12.99]|jgi:CIC family chloride channel protein|nr:H(+)/Cl(-) exchange transporter ClcA [Chroococcopsis gigantea SAG 12.99]